MDRDYDVVVVGGGVAGVASAMAASSMGVKVALVERSSTLGGKATSAYVGTVCGAYYRSNINNGLMVSNGFLRDFIDRLGLRSKTEVVIYKNGLQFLPYDCFDFERLCDEYIRNSAVDLFLQSNLINLNIEDNILHSCDINVYNDNINIRSKSFIDCTGDAFLGSLIGLDLIQSDKYQGASKVFGLENIEDISTENLKLLIFKSIKKAIIDKKLINEFTQISIVPGSHKERRVYLKIGIPISINNAINRMTEINLLARELIESISEILIQEVDCMRNAHLGMISSDVGIRTGRRHKGKYMLTKRDVLEANKSPYSIARGSWPIEYWYEQSSPRMEYFNEDDYYDIPAGCLISEKIENLFFAGRNISAEDDAIASARVIGTCLQTGYAAGILAGGYTQEISEEKLIDIIRRETII